MDNLAKLVLGLTYPFLLIGGMLNRLRGRDPLRLSKPAGQGYWVERPLTVAASEFLSEESSLEGHAHGGCGGLAARLIRWAAAAFAPSRRSGAQATRVMPGRDPELPDEVYTLW